MYKIIFESVLNGQTRTATPKEKVNGYKHTESNGIHFYKRGKIAFIVDTNHGCTLEKFDYSKHRYLSVDYDDFHHFIIIENVKQYKFFKAWLQDEYFNCIPLFSKIDGVLFERWLREYAEIIDNYWFISGRTAERFKLPYNSMGYIVKYRIL